MEKSESSMKKFVMFFIIGMVLSSCGARVAVTNEPGAPTVELTATSEFVPAPTQTPVPTLTATLTPTLDLGEIGLPSEPAGAVAYDFVEQLCAAQWHNRGGALPCPGDASQADQGYVLRYEGELQGAPAGFPMLMSFPPLVHYSAISGTYPAFAVQTGDRFRAVLACQARAYCDVQFVLSYSHGQGEVVLKRWAYLFVEAPIRVDLSLANLAGKTVQFELTAVGVVKQTEAFAVWVAPHIYRPVP